MSRNNSINATLTYRGESVDLNGEGAEKLVGKVVESLRRAQGEDELIEKLEDNGEYDAADALTREPEKPKNELKWWPAEEVEDVAKVLINQYHQHIEDYDLKVLYLYAADPPKVDGRDCWGTAKKISGQNAYLFTLAQAKILKERGFPLPDFLKTPMEAKGFFVITIWHKIWITLTPEQRMALVDHELCHCQFREDKEGNISPAMRGHDFEDFNEILQRWGYWHEGLERAFESAKREHRKAA